MLVRSFIRDYRNTGLIHPSVKSSRSSISHLPIGHRPFGSIWAPHCRARAHFRRWPSSGTSRRSFRPSQSTFPYSLATHFIATIHARRMVHTRFRTNVRSCHPDPCRRPFTGCRRAPERLHPLCTPKHVPAHARRVARRGPGYRVRPSTITFQIRLPQPGPALFRRMQSGMCCRDGCDIALGWISSANSCGSERSSPSYRTSRAALWTTVDSTRPCCRQCIVSPTLACWLA